jgi:ribosomal protein L22
VRKKVCIGNQVTTTKLVDELETAKYSKGLIERALQNMIKNAEMKELKGRKMLTRLS